METFVVRVYVPTDGQPIDLHGLLEHVGSGRTEPFHNSSELLITLRSLLAPATVDGHRPIEAGVESPVADVDVETVPRREPVRLDESRKAVTE